MEQRIELKCPVCGGLDFSVRKALMNKRMMTLLNIEFFDDYMYGYVCSSCSHIDWFTREVNLIKHKGRLSDSGTRVDQEA